MFSVYMSLVRGGSKEGPCTCAGAGEGGPSEGGKDEGRGELYVLHHFPQ